MQTRGICEIHFAVTQNITIIYNPATSSQTIPHLTFQQFTLTADTAQYKTQSKSTTYTVELSRWLLVHAQ